MCRKIYGSKERLFQAIKYSKMPQAELAKRIKVSQPTVHQYIYGGCYPLPKTLVKMAKVLHVSLLWLAGANVKSTYDDSFASSIIQNVDMETKQQKKFISLLVKYNGKILPAYEEFLSFVIPRKKHKRFRCGRSPIRVYKLFVNNVAC